MTTPRAAYEEYTLDYGPHAIALRPTLGAATHLERLHDGFPALLNKLAEFDTATIRAIITHSADRQEANALLAYASTQPLQAFKQAAQAPLYALIVGLLPEAPAKQEQPQTPATPTPWAKVYSQLLGIATGWLGWTPDTAWQATPTEITRAFAAHIESLKAVHGSADQETETMTDDQREQNIADGLDPEFNRNALQALKAKLS